MFCETGICQCLRRASLRWRTNNLWITACDRVATVDSGLISDDDNDDKGVMVFQTVSNCSTSDITLDV